MHAASGSHSDQPWHYFGETATVSYFQYTDYPILCMVFITKLCALKRAGKICACTWRAQTFTECASKWWILAEGILRQNSFCLKVSSAHSAFGTFGIANVQSYCASNNRVAKTWRRHGGGRLLCTFAFPGSTNHVYHKCIKISLFFFSFFRHEMFLRTLGKFTARDLYVNSVSPQNFKRKMCVFLQSVNSVSSLIDFSGNRRHAIHTSQFSCPLNLA